MEAVRRKTTDEERVFVGDRPGVAREVTFEPAFPWRKHLTASLSVIVALLGVILWFERGWRTEVKENLTESTKVHASLDHRVTANEVAEVAHAAEMKRLNEQIEGLRGEQREFFRWVYERAGDDKRARGLGAKGAPVQAP